MKKEVYTIKLVKSTLNISNNKIDSIRKNNSVKSACRVYDNGCIGVSGCFGELTEETWKTAEENLQLQIPYNYEIEADKNRKEDRAEESISEKEFMEKSEKMLAQLCKENPNFIFSNKISMIHSTQKLTNSEKTDLEFHDTYYNLSIVYKHKNSNGIMDGGIIASMRKFNCENFLKDAHEILSAYEKNAELPKEEYIHVVLNFYNVGNKILSGLSAYDLGKGASIFSEKMGEKLFSDKFTLYADRTNETYGSAFFDMEGTTLDNDKINLIENGILKRALCDKKNEAEFGFENTACAFGSYDDVPSLGLCDINIEKSDKTLKELIGNGKAIFISDMSGGDCTPDGNFASPVQLAYLMENGKLVGKLPEFNVSGNIYKMFGDDYLGLSSDKVYFGSEYLVLKMKIN